MAASVLPAYNESRVSIVEETFMPIFAIAKEGASLQNQGQEHDITPQIKHAQRHGGSRLQHFVPRSQSAGAGGFIQKEC